MSDKETRGPHEPGSPPGSGDPAGTEESEVEMLLLRIATLEDRIATLEEDRKFRSARGHALLSEVRALIAEAEACPNRAHHTLIERDAAGRPARLEAIYDEAFLVKAAEIGLANPRRFL